MAASPDAVRKAALVELAKRELASRQAQAAPSQAAAPTEPQPQGFWPKFNAISQQVAGAGETAAQMGTGMLGSLLGHGAAMVAEAPGIRVPGTNGSDEFASKIENAFTFQPRTQTGKLISSGVQSLMAPVGGFIDWTSRGFPSSPETDTSSAFLRHGIQFGLGVLGAKGAAEMATKPRAAPKIAPKAAPTIEELTAQKNAAYKAAESSGAIATSEGIGKVATQAEEMLANEGYRPGLHPATKEALAAIYEDSTQPGVVGQTMKGIEGLRREVGAAESAAYNARNFHDARLAGNILDTLDEYIDTLAPQFREARGLNTRLRKAQDIEALVERAKNSAGSYTQAGFETSLRNQFRQLADNAKRFKRFSAEERDAILKVVRGGPVQALARWVGKLAPRGVVSATAGSVLGGGPAGAATLGALGEGARAIATGLRSNAASAVSELVRRGPSAPKTAAAAAREVPPSFTVAPAIANSTFTPEQIDEMRRRSNNSLSSRRSRNALAR